MLGGGGGACSANPLPPAPQHLGDSGGTPEPGSSVWGGSENKQGASQQCPHPPELNAELGDKASKCPWPGVSWQPGGPWSMGLRPRGAGSRVMPLRVSTGLGNGAAQSWGWLHVVPGPAGAKLAQELPWGCWLHFASGRALALLVHRGEQLQPPTFPWSLPARLLQGLSPCSQQPAPVAGAIRGR